MNPTDYWPNDVGYNTFSGITLIHYPDEKNRTNKDLRYIFDSWKYTCEQHRLDMPAIKAVTLSQCTEQHADCYSITYVDSDTAVEKKSIHGTISKLDVECDVNESPFTKETFVTLRIGGIDARTSKQFTLAITIDRYPSKVTTVSLY